MVFETVKKTVLNLVLAATGFVTGRVIGSSGTIHRVIQRTAKTFFRPTESKPNVDEVEVEEKDKRGSLKNLKEHYQRKEGFRR